MKLTVHKLRHWGVQIVRRCVQLSVFGLLFWLVYLSLYAHYRAARVMDEPSELTGNRGKILTRIHEEFEPLKDDEAQQFLDDNKGTVWSMRLGGFDLTDPLAAAEATAASRKMHVPLLWQILIPVGVTLLLGKVFCSWICPAALLFEITGKLRSVLRLAELPPGNVQFSRINKYALLLIGLIAALIVGRPLFALVYPPAAVSRLIHGWVFGTTVTGILILLGIIIVVELFVSPRWWCRTMCPGGALYGLIGWPRLLRVKLRADRCTSCGKCAPVCEPGLDPVRESDGLECDNCGVCVRACPDKALRFAIGLPCVRKKPTKPGDPNLVKITLMLLAALAMFGVSDVALAHHILGLPHYSYKENYPQAPVLEYPATTGPYDVLLVCYPGKPTPGQPANLVFDIKNRDSGERYKQPIGVRVIQTFTFGENLEVLPSTEVQAFDVLHKLSAVFPDDGEYVVELTMDVEGQEEVIGFLMVAGDPSSTMSILLAVGCGLVVFLVVIRAVKVKRDRRRAAEES